MAPQVFAERLERLEAEVKEMKKRQQEFEAKIEEREKFRQELEKIKDSREKERIALFSIICSLIVALVMLLLRFI
jgi:DNA repair exonuclease SbcCD ATPase subunit